MESKSGGYRKGNKRYNTPYQGHFLTFSCYRRQPFFSGTLAADWFLESLQEARQAERFSILAFVVMPEHVHLLLSPGKTYDIGRILWRIKRPVTHRALKYVRQNDPEFLTRMAHEKSNGAVSHRFWQRGGGYDRNLWNPKVIRETIRYIHMNPVKRGLVNNPEDWPWSSYRAFTGGPQEPIPLDLSEIPIVIRRF